ncbi:NADH-quinone oxidoreductase subunit H [Nonomuraea sp. NPDC059194]|uniref:NADH-quinone oxidoreductase subunit H n=1 Tax=Nonomuraea sp. NPDC059194 TaxID=3346764 RepID=UPI0036A87A8C
MRELLALAALALGAAILDGALTTRSPAAALRETARLLLQQRRCTLLPDTPLMRIGVISLPFVATLAMVVLPLDGAPLVDSSVGIVWFNAMEVCAWASLWLTGWGCNSVYPLIGGYRFLAQGLAYELPHMFALITAALGAGSLDLRVVEEAQRGAWFALWMPVAFAIYLVSALAMAFWGPMSRPLGTDLAGGVTAELSGPDRLVFQAGRYLMLAVAAWAAGPLFLGGGSLLKAAVVLAFLVLVRHRVPAIRMDRFTQASWLVLLPLALLQLLVVGIVVI